MPKPWLLLDTNFLCWRAFHSMGGLSFQGELTGVLFGVFRDALNLQERFETDRIAFCFDSKESDRKVMYPKYKSKRSKKYQEASEEEAELLRELRRQMRDLRRQHLPDIGFRNVFLQKGKEADDLIASICKEYPATKKVIVSSDEDLFQLINGKTSIWNPNKERLLTLEWFAETYGLNHPFRWADVKAIAGCATDDVEGIRGVGEKTAIEYIKGFTDVNSKKHEAIILGLKTIERNKKLVTLPLKGTDPIRLLKDRVTPERWAAKAEEFGMSSIRDAVMGTNKQWRNRRGKETKTRRGKGFGV